jgi:hypothetical protein
MTPQVAAILTDEVASGLGVVQASVVGARVIHLADAAKVDVTTGALDVIVARVVAMGRPGSCRVAASYWTIVSYHVLLTHFRGRAFECFTVSGFLGTGDRYVWKNKSVQNIRGYWRNGTEVNGGRLCTYAAGGGEFRQFACC